jgi:septal ring factor EnvC (AmiA/AmiB activator)
MPLRKTIAKLLSLPEDGTGSPTLAALENTLTDGYAETLALEAERLRIERRLREIDDELAHLRPLLRALQDRARSRRRNAA